jgi:hypothetical protein
MLLLSRRDELVPRVHLNDGPRESAVESGRSVIMHRIGAKASFVIGVAVFVSVLAWSATASTAGTDCASRMATGDFTNSPPGPTGAPAGSSGLSVGHERGESPSVRLSHVEIEVPPGSEVETIRPTSLDIPPCKGAPAWEVTLSTPDSDERLHVVVTRQPSRTVIESRGTRDESDDIVGPSRETDTLIVFFAHSSS